MRSILLLLAAAVGALPARAQTPAWELSARVEPGGSAAVDDPFEQPPVAGTLLAEKVLPFTAVYRLGTAPDGYDFVYPHVAEGSLTASVYRTADGTLTFRYATELDALPEGDRPGEVQSDESNWLTVGHFAGRTTDVTGDFGHTGFFMTRTPDGSELTGNVESGGAGEPPILIVDTDATAFDELGTVTYEPAGEFLLHSDEHLEAPWTSWVCSATVELAGVYQPVVVPEPATVMPLLLGAACFAAPRKRAPIRV